MEPSNHRAEPKGDGDGDGDGEFFPELLGFCSRAQALIAELLLLSDRVPSEFRDRRFDPVLFDLRYFDSPSDFESRIEGNMELEALEDQLRESCSAFLQRFFLLANGAVLYHLELLKYLNDMQEGVHVQCTLDKVLENDFGLQLLTEAMSLFGCLLLLMEHRMSGFLREKLLVAHVRHDRCFDSPNLEQICLLCRVHLPPSGSFHHVSSLPWSSAMISVQKPEDLFARFPFPKLVVDAVLCCIRGNDVYNQVRCYPDPQHRTVALSLQGGCLFVLLFYSPEFLQNGFVMREIVDRFFKDYWVVPIFLYFSVDLFVSWDAYKEAKTSLSSCLSPTFIRDRSQLHCTKVKDLLSELSSVLSNGILTKEFVLDNSQHLLTLVRNCNVTLRWLMLHRTCVDKKLKDLVSSSELAHKIDDDSLLLLLLKASQLEFEMKKLYAELLESREALWHEKKHRTSDCLEELSKHCSGSWGSACKIKAESLKDLFGKLSLEVHSLDFGSTGSSGRTIYRVVSALKEAEQFHQIEENLQIKQHLSEAQKCLQEMIKILNFEKGTMSTFSMIIDAVYAWGSIERLTELLRKKIEQDSTVLLTLHTFFLKFQPLLNVPLLRIEQNKSPDLLCVSSYYSSVYAAKICATLQTIPVMLFRIFHDDDGLQSGKPIHLFHRINQDNIQNFMQLDQQFALTEAAKEVSIFSQGILVMSMHFVGLISLDLKVWLEGQIRKDLSKRLENKLNSFFLATSVGRENLEASLRKLSTYILSQLEMMESFQDLLHMFGGSSWEEIFTKVLKQCAEKEQAGYIKRQQEHIVSAAQLNDFTKAQTFFGHLLHQVVQLTDPSRSMFLEPMSGWFDAEGHELLGLDFFHLLESCVGQVGLASLDSLLILHIKQSLENAFMDLKNLMDARCLEELSKLDDSFGPSTSIPLLGWSSYKQMVKIVTASWERWVECLAFIGQLQLLRCLISLKLKSTCKVKASTISFAAAGIITSVYSQRDKILKCMESEDQDNATVRLFLRALNKQRKICGFFSPLQTTYISKDPPPFLARSASVISVSQLPRYVHDPHLGTLTSRLKKSTLDFSPLVIGLGTFLRQFQPCYVTQYVQYMGQYIRTTAEAAFGAVCDPQKESTDPASEVLKSAFWLMYFCKCMGIPKDLLDSCLPPSIIAVLQT